MILYKNLQLCISYIFKKCVQEKTLINTIARIRYGMRQVYYMHYNKFFNLIEKLATNNFFR